MAGTPGTQTVFGIEIRPEERTPLVEMLLRVIEDQRQRIEQLEEEIRRLKGLPDLPKRPRMPSRLNDPAAFSAAAGGHGTGGRPRDGKRPGSAKRAKTRELAIQETIPLLVDGLPPGTEFRGYRDFVVQDLRIEPHNTCYRRGVYLLPDGTWVTADLPKEVNSHFGPTLRSYVLYQHFHNHVTQPLLHEELRELGVDLSTGQIDRLLSEGHEAFHREKDSLLSAAREVSAYFHTDDTSARHCGKAGHTLHIGNEFFAAFFTTDSKTRVNFLKVLLTPDTDYVFNADALFYLEWFEVSERLRTQLQPDADAWRVFADDAAWERQLTAWGLTSDEQRRLVTEAALWASLLAHDLYTDMALISDDAAQFKVLSFLHGLCWVHMERHVNQLLPLTDAERTAHAAAREAIWNYYQRLKAYRDTPTPQRRGRLERDFDRLFLQATGWSELDAALQKIHGKKEQLLVVLEHPEIPLHNNPSENDIRQYVKKRKISAGTRSDAGRRCRDTFLSLKTTCRKLGVTFWRYLQDRIQGLHVIPPLGELIRQKATQA